MRGFILQYEKAVEVAIALEQQLGLIFRNHQFKFQYQAILTTEDVNNIKQAQKLVEQLHQLLTEKFLPAQD